MTAPELMEITLMLREEAQRQFEYWLTISFAFIAGTFMGRRLLARKVAVLFGGMYLLTVTLLIVRYSVSGNAASLYLDLAIQQGAAPIGGSQLITYLRLAVFLSGTFLSLWFLYVNSRDRNVNT